MKKAHIWLPVVLVAQLLILGAIVGKRERIMANGDVVYLKTMPVDPRDIFRGDYVVLDYELVHQAKGVIQNNNISTDNPYLRLQPNKRGVAQLVSVDSNKPQEGLFIRGFSNTVNYSEIPQLRLGIEKYFVEQGAGKELEALRGQAQSWQTPLEVQVALGEDGTPVITGHRFSPIRTRTRFADLEDTLPQRDRSPQHLEFSIENNNLATLSVFDNKIHCGFTLVHAETLRPVSLNRDCSEAALERTELSAGATYQVTIDLSQPQWQVKGQSDPLSLAGVDGAWQGFRLLYRDQSGADDGEQIISARFFRRGGID
ncbi:GDYXXLXY domain-containing protein [Bowmanella yangjiangensis]|uniref:GDYXXLXY domain-containing protein n=1 Tax=Bowmanella yangjiangensis TaxID=2811230 RepID=A0ABS3CSD3_9ALTE|nr:GDYXXLXY domain-containing protein [Bowmanella yangjiangensis]MBN7819965.1 GDYXXLXY domain-containing protein [Bowmanella yangjiangensis]